MLRFAGRRCHCLLRGCLPSTGRGTICFTQREHMWHGPFAQYPCKGPAYCLIQQFTDKKLGFICVGGPSLFQRL